MAASFNHDGIVRVFFIDLLLKVFKYSLTSSSIKAIHSLPSKLIFCNLDGFGALLNKSST